MITINHKADIIIPFDRIGEAGWTEQTGRIITALDDNWSREAAEPLSVKEIMAIESRLGVALPDSLKLFYQTFGIAGIGEELQEPGDIGYLKDIWRHDPEYGPRFTDEDQKVLPHLITFSEYLGNGNLFCFHAQTQAIYYFDHESQPYLHRLFDRADDYLKGCLIFAQSDLFGNVEQEEVDSWAEEIVSGLFGSEVVKIWKY